MTFCAIWPINDLKTIRGDRSWEKHERNIRHDKIFIIETLINDQWNDFEDEDTIEEHVGFINTMIY